MIRPHQGHTTMAEPLEHRRMNLPHAAHHELQCLVYESFICVGLFDYESGELLTHVDVPLQTQPPHTS